MIQTLEQLDEVFLHKRVRRTLVVMVIDGFFDGEVAERAERLCNSLNRSDTIKADIITISDDGIYSGWAPPDLDTRHSFERQDKYLKKLYEYVDAMGYKARIEWRPS